MIQCEDFPCQKGNVITMLTNSTILFRGYLEFGTLSEMFGFLVIEISLCIFKSSADIQEKIMTEGYIDCLFECLQKQVCSLQMLHNDIKK